MSEQINQNLCPLEQQSSKISDLKDIITNKIVLLYEKSINKIQGCLEESKEIIHGNKYLFISITIIALLALITHQNVEDLDSGSQIQPKNQEPARTSNSQNTQKNRQNGNKFKPVSKIDQEQDSDKEDTIFFQVFEMYKNT